MLQEASLLLDAPGFVHRAGDRAEDAERRPDQAEPAGDADLRARLPKRVELRGDEVELRREIAEDEGQDRDAVLVVRGDRTQERDDQEQKRKEREQRVVGDRRRVRQIAAVDQLDEAAPRGESGQAQLGAEAAQDPARRHHVLWLRE